MAVSLGLVGLLLPWIGLAAWAALLAHLRRAHPWLRSAPLAVALVVTTLAVDAATIVATMRMSTTGGRSLAIALLWVAYLLSITTWMVLRAPAGGRGGDGDDPRSPGEPPEPPWWPEFERAFRDYDRTRRRWPRAKPPRHPAGRP